MFDAKTCYENSFDNSIKQESKMDVIQRQIVEKCAKGEFQLEVNNPDEEVLTNLANIGFSITMNEHTIINWQTPYKIVLCDEFNSENNFPKYVLPNKSVFNWNTRFQEKPTDDIKMKLLFNDKEVMCSTIAKEDINVGSIMEIKFAYKELQGFNTVRLQFEEVNKPAICKGYSWLTFA